MRPFTPNTRRWVRFVACATVAVISVGAFSPVRAQAPERIEIRPVEITYRVTLPPSVSAGDQLSRAARVIPVVEGGAITGYRVSAVRAGGLLARAGWQSGDILRTVEGEAVESAERALQLYTRLENTDRVRMVIERGGQPIRLNYVIERLGAAAPEPKPKPKQTPHPKAASPTGPNPGWIRSTGDGAYTVERAGLDVLLANPARLTRSARVVPAREGDAFVGFKIYGIRPASLMDDLGLRNGDLVRRVNGLEVATPQQAMAAYVRLHDADGFTVELVRGGAPMTLRYTLVGEPAAPAAPEDL